MILDNFQLLNVLSSRMTASEFAHAAGILLTYHKFHNHPRMFEMYGTPLNEAIVAAMDIVPQFQKKHKLQVVNTVFLTDGEGQCSTTIRGVKNNYQQGVMVIRDPVSKAEASMIQNNNNWGRELTATYIKLLKARTNCNIVGFYIASRRDLANNAENFLEEKLRGRDADLIEKNTKINQMRQEFRTNHYVIVKSAGYDEYYILRSDKMDTADEVFEVKENASMRVLATAFSKYTASKRSNRVVLSRFIDLIA